VIVHWTQTALRHLSAIHDFIAQDSPHYAREVVDRITGRSGQIGHFPESGRAVPEYPSDKVREVLEDPYRIVYRVGSERVDVLAVIHTSRRRGARGLGPV
jgi:plasmid stabilization system protein ParE